MNEIIEMGETISLEKEMVHFSFVNFLPYKFNEKRDSNPSYVDS